MWSNISKKRKCTQEPKNKKIFVWKVIISLICSQSLQKRLNIYWFSQRPVTWLWVKLLSRWCAAANLYFALSTSFKAQWCLQALPENHFFAATLFSLFTITDHTSLFHQISRNFCPVFLIPCFPRTWGACHTAPKQLGVAPQSATWIRELTVLVT